MKIECFEKVFPYIIVDDFYDKEELRLVWEELNFLCYTDKMNSQSHLENGSAVDEYGKDLKNNLCVYLDRIYTERRYSNILSCNKKLFANNFSILRTHKNWFYQNYIPNLYYTSVSYYESGGFYKPHYDECSITALSWFYKEPKLFEGGELYFPNFNINVEIKNNRMLIFPSSIIHSVLPVKMKEENINKKMGRFCISQFLVTSMETSM